MTRRKNKKVTIDIYDRDTDKYQGTIKRVPLSSRSFGNFGAVKYSIKGKEYWSVGGKELNLPKTVIQWLRNKGELR